MTRCAATSNTSHGVRADASTIYVSDSTIVGNAQGVVGVSGGEGVLSRGNNTLQGNGSNGTFTGTFTPD